MNTVTYNEEPIESSVISPVHKSSLNKQDSRLYVLSRWAALYESVNMIADKAEEKQIPFENIDLKPLKILEYVESTSDIIMRKLLEENKNVTKRIEND
jgi:hypothetical protein